MKTKWLVNKINKKNDIQIKNLIAIYFLFNCANKNLILLKDIKKEFKILKINELFFVDIKQFLDFINNFEKAKIIKKIILDYLKVYNLALDCSKINYFFFEKIKKSNKEIVTDNDKYILLFKAIDELNNYIITNLNFNYSLVIEYIRDTLIEVVNEK